MGAGDGLAIFLPLIKEVWARGIDAKGDGMAKGSQCWVECRMLSDDRAGDDGKLG